MEVRAVTEGAVHARGGNGCPLGSVHAFSAPKHPPLFTETCCHGAVGSRETSNLASTAGHPRWTFQEPLQ